MDNDKNITGWDRLEKDKMKSKHRLKDEAFPTYVRKSRQKNMDWKQTVKNKLSPFKHIIIASVSAVFIGSILGLVMLQLLTNLNGTANHHSQAVSHQDNKEDSTPTTDEEMFTVEKMEGVVLQGGVFQDQKNAEELMNTIEQLGFPAVLWKQEDRYLLFAGISQTKDIATSLAKDFAAEELDGYVKEWQTEPFQIKLQEDEFVWVEDLQRLWKQSVHDIDQGEKIDISSWKNLAREASWEQMSLGQMEEKFKKLPANDSEMRPEEEQAFLLNIWKEFAKLAKK